MGIVKNDSRIAISILYSVECNLHSTEWLSTAIFAKEYPVPLHRDFGQAMGIAGHLYVDLIEQLLRPHGVTYAQFTVLLHLARAKTRSRVSDIARAVGLTQPAATKIIQKFQQLGLVEGVRDATDARNRPTAITPAGFQKITAFQASFGPVFDQLLAGLDDDELARATTFLQVLIHRLDDARKNLHP
jgi:DNA-binding MarR family transcriptional regulator